MADFSATDVAFSGFRFVRERPVTVAIWSGIQIVISPAVGGPKHRPRHACVDDGVDQQAERQDNGVCREDV